MSVSKQGCCQRSYPPHSLQRHNTNWCSNIRSFWKTWSSNENIATTSCSTTKKPSNNITTSQPNTPAPPVINNASLLERIQRNTSSPTNINTNTTTNTTTTNINTNKFKENVPDSLATNFPIMTFVYHHWVRVIRSPSTSTTPRIELIHNERLPNGRFNLFVDPNTTAIKHVLTLYSFVLSSFLSSPSGISSPF